NGFILRGHSLFSPILILPLAAGIGFSFMKKAPPFARALALLLLLVPLTNSALAIVVLNDTFLLPLVPLVSLTVAYGVVELFQRAGNVRSRIAYAAAGLAVGGALFGAGSFFVSEPLLEPAANGMTPTMFFAYGNALRIARREPALEHASTLCLGVSDRLGS